MPTEYFLVLLMFGTFIGLLFTGFPIAFVLGGTACVFSLVGYFSDLYLGSATGIGFNPIGMIVSRIYSLMSNWVLVAVPMFIFMGLVLEHAGLAEHMMKSMQALFGKVRGGLAITVAVIGIILAASTGIMGASVTLLGILSLPIMLGQGYNKCLAVGIVGASGTLGILIPPSIMLVVMADQLAISVGDLFMGAVFPGLVLGGLYIVFILIYGLVYPKGAPLPPDARPVSWKILGEVLLSVLPAAGLIVIVLGSIFAGLATPTEASGVGAAGAILLVGARGRLNLKMIQGAAIETFKTTAFVFGIFVGATFFALVMRLLGGDMLIENLLAQIPLGPYGIIMVILGVIFLLGFFLDWIEISLIILPLVAPAISKMGLNINGYGVVENPALVWFTVLNAVILQTSFLTPPVGFTIFFLQGIVPRDVLLWDIYKGIMPFVILQLMGAAAVIIWPELVTWLPSMAYK
jgi:tripartite ATP-independent transporter DctM subunit